MINSDKDLYTVVSRAVMSTAPEQVPEGAIPMLCWKCRTPVWVARSTVQMHMQHLYEGKSFMVIECMDCWECSAHDEIQVAPGAFEELREMEQRAKSQSN